MLVSFQHAREGAISSAAEGRIQIRTVPSAADEANRRLSENARLEKHPGVPLEGVGVSWSSCKIPSLDQRRGYVAVTIDAHPG